MKGLYDYPADVRDQIVSALEAMTKLADTLDGPNRTRHDVVSIDAVRLVGTRAYAALAAMDRWDSRPLDHDLRTAYTPTRRAAS